MAGLLPLGAHCAVPPPHPPAKPSSAYPPCSSFVPEPKTVLHAASAEVNQLWTIGVLVLMARASTTMRLVVVAAVALATILTLPPRMWRPQLARLTGLCAFVFVLTAIGKWGANDLISLFYFFYFLSFTLRCGTV